jgi:hypothetical protein
MASIMHRTRKSAFLSVPLPNVWSVINALVACYRYEYAASKPAN